MSASLRGIYDAGRLISAQTQMPAMLKHTFLTVKDAVLPPPFQLQRQARDRALLSAAQGEDVHQRRQMKRRPVKVRQNWLDIRGRLDWVLIAKALLLSMRSVELDLGMMRMEMKFWSMLATE